MATHRNPATFARAVQKRIESMGANVIEAHREVVALTYDFARQRVSGATKTKQLRKENHPFGYGFTTPKGKRRRSRKPLPINVQSGRMRSSLKLGTKGLGPRYVYSINFKGAPEYVKYVLSDDGTKKMRPRGYWRSVKMKYKSGLLGVKLALRK